MSNEQNNGSPEKQDSVNVDENHPQNTANHPQDKKASRGASRNRDEVYSKRVPAGKRTYFFDVKTTRSGEDFFVTITESKRIDEGRYEKHKIFLYKEDFGKFVSAMHEVILHIKDDRLPEYEFRGLPELDGEGGNANESARVVATADQCSSSV